MERRLEAERAARNLLQERMARKQLEAATDKKLLEAEIKHLKEAQQQQQQMTSMKEAQQQQIVRLEEKIEKAAMLQQIRELQKDLAHLSSRSHSPTSPENGSKNGGIRHQRLIRPS